MRLTGVSVQVDGSLRGEHPLQSIMFAEVGCMLADLPAFKEMLGCKGHSGHMPCCLCRNACNHAIQGTPLHLACADAVPITEFEWAKFIKHTDDTIKEVVHRLNEHHTAMMAGDMTRDEFEAREMVLGWNWVRDNPILVEKYRLRIASIVMFDWAHVYVNDGLADLEFGKCMKVLHSHRTDSTYSELGQYIARFTLPKKAVSITRLFTDAANKNNLRKGGFICSGSEFLMLTPIALRYFERVVAARDQCMPWVVSLIAVLKVVVMLIRLKTCSVSDVALTEAIKTHLVLFKAAYGEDGIRPKHHQALHLGPMLARFPFLLSTFVNERRHRVVKKHTRDRRNLRSFDLGTIEEITCHQIWELGKPLLHTFQTSKPRGPMLDVIREMFPHGDASFMLAHNIKVDGGAANAGDVVSFTLRGEKKVGELLVNVVVVEHGTETPLSIISMWQLAADHQAWPSFVVSEHQILKVPIEQVEAVHIYSMALDRTTCIVYDP